jgi:hypothetical protein
MVCAGLAARSVALEASARQEMSFAPQLKTQAIQVSHSP